MENNADYANVSTQLLSILFNFAIENMAFVTVLVFIAFSGVLSQAKNCVENSECSVSEVGCSAGTCASTSHINESCILNYDCQGDGYCCSDICRESCVGYYCSFDIDCGAPNENCCYGTCQKGTCLPGWAIALIVIASLFAFGFLSALLYWCYSYRRSTPGRFVILHPQTAVVSGAAVNYGSVYAKP
jgi:hypothetical protein